MEIDIYWTSLLLLLAPVVLFTGRWLLPQTTWARGRKGETAGHDGTSEKPPNDEEARRFRRKFLQVYLLVMGSEWLQARSHPALHHAERRQR